MRDRKLGRGGKAKATVAAPQSRPQRQQGVGQMGSIGGSRSGSGSLGGWFAVCGRVLGALGPSGESRVGLGRDRERQWRGRSTCIVADKAVSRFHPRDGAAPNGNERQAATAGDRGANHVVTRGRRCRSRLSGVFVEGLVPKSAQACWWTGEGRNEDRQVQAQRSRVDGFHWCS